MHNLTKYLVVGIILSIVLQGGIAFAQEISEAELEAVELAESVTLEDLGVENPGLLPTSPFYFFKEWGRGIQSFFTFNSVAKAELEVKFVNEKAAELKVVEESGPDDEKGIARALSNFQRAQEKLSVRLERLAETSENPNIDRLLDKVVEKSILHDKLLQEVEGRHKDKAEILVRLKDAASTIAQVVSKAAEKDSPEKFVQRLKKALEETRGSVLKDVRAVEILDRIGKSVSEKVRVRLDVVRDGFKEKAKLRIEALAEEGEDKVRAILEHVPGDDGRRAVVLEEIRLKISDRASNALRKAQDAVEEKLSNAVDRKERATEQIRRAREILEKAQLVMREQDNVREAVKNLLIGAEQHLVSAKEAFEQEQYGEAFGQARASEVSSRNALRALERGEDSPTILELQRVGDRVQDRVRLIKPITPVSSDSNDTVACTQEYRPVCGVNGETYSNRCNAEKQNRIKVSYEGECRDDVELNQDREDDNTNSRLRIINPVDILQKITPQFLAPLRQQEDALKSVE